MPGGDTHHIVSLYKPTGSDYGLTDRLDLANKNLIPTVILVDLENILPLYIVEVHPTVPNIWSFRNIHNNRARNKQLKINGDASQLL